jgi:transcriptional regulator with XRE-family HTH domain
VPYPEQLVTTLREARKKSGFSQRVLAEKLGFPQSHISKIESGKISPTISSLIEIARVLGFELMAVPKKYTLIVESFAKERHENQHTQQPAYSLDDEDSDDGGGGDGSGHGDGSGEGFR